ncbi:uncharacterized protein LOC135841113 [Planococcus citri]|uniref:uncharacterized protein LOC135841113 n=1 Tax=Planococcus citri TaxID=170843 RepID=UPI0031F8A612
MVTSSRISSTRRINMIEIFALMVLSSLVSISSATSSSSSIPSPTPAAATDTSWSIVPAFVSKLYQDCERKEYEFLDCLKIKSISLLDRIGRSDVIELDDSMKIVREGKRSEGARALTENDIESSIVGTDEKSSLLNDMLVEKISKFANTHVLKIGLPKIDVSSIAKSLGEGRGKMKKTMGMFMMAAMMKAMMMIPMSIGILFILAGKALIISKIALVLSLLITLKKLLSKPTEHVVHESHGWNPSGGSGGWDKRSYRPPVQDTNAYNQNVHAQNLAYNSYVNH